MKRINRPAIAQDITELVGNTPLLSLSKINKDLEGEIIVKLESFNPLSSIKDRIAYGMITKAEARGELSVGDTLVEPTSGNTGIGLAFIAAVKGYSLILTMPDTMSIERRKLLKALGADLVLTPGAKGMNGAISKAGELAQEHGYKMLQQFNNPDNPAIHRETTALEIWDDTKGSVDIFISGIGTGGTITGTGEVLKKLNPKIQIIAVEPDTSAILSGEKAGPHKIQGIGAGFVPEVLNTEIYDEVIRIANCDAFASARELAKKEGVLVGISSGAAFAAAKKVAMRPENKGKKIVVIFPDSGERYLSTALFDEI